jgi:tetratricopeptide (TPR) repeat protein
MPFHILKPNRLRFAALTGALVLTLGVAHAAPLTYTETIAAARVQFNKGDYVGAQKTTEEALLLAQTPEEKSGALMRLGLIFRERKMVVQAREQWTKMLQLPDNSDSEKVSAQAIIATSYGEEEDWDNSRTEFQKVLAMPAAGPQEKAAAHLGLAIGYMNQKKLADAQREFTANAEDTQLDVNTRASSYLMLGQMLSDAKEYDQARLAFSKAAELTSNTPEQIPVTAQAMIAQSFKAQGDAKQAQAEFVKAQTEALKRVTWFQKRKLYPQARALLQQVLTFGTVKPVNDASVRLLIAQSFVDENKPAEAIQQVEEFLKKDYGPELSPKDKATLETVRQGAQLTLAKGYKQQQNDVKAKEILTNLLVTPGLVPNFKVGAEDLLKTLN